MEVPTRTDIRLLTLRAAKTDLILEIFYLQKQFERKHLREEVFIRSHTITLVQISLYYKVTFKSMRVADDTFWWNSIPVNSTDLSSTLLISDPKNAVYWLSTWFEEIYWLATDFADLEKFSIFFSASRSVCSLQCISPDPITVVIHPYHQGVHS